jgi:hypothetical protein
MDVYGDSPDATVGEYFRNNVWWWHPLWDYCIATAPRIFAEPRNRNVAALGHSNDAAGLNADDSKQLADLLRAEIDGGDTLQYANERQAKLDAIPMEKCDICGGTGKRAEPPAKGPGDIPCNACDAKGERKSLATWYPFNVQNVEAFIQFLDHCGGFKIC